MATFTLWDIVRDLLMGLRWTVLLSLIAFVGGGAVTVLCVWGRLSGMRWVNRLISGYIAFFQGTPLLMQLFLIFFGLSVWQINLSPLVAASVGLTLFTGAFLADIWWAAFRAISKGQWHAARVLGMTRAQTVRYIIVRQAFRHAIAPTVGLAVQVIKNTALASAIGVAEMTRIASIINNATLQPLTLFGLLALGYFCLCYPLSRYARHLEERLDVNGSR
ncbi:amino acid ABC transporter permease [Zymobacter palmae]|uniref:ABC-type amino acid transport system, permease n=1 Tax=Zymobacter palmae TaxID=33074 RepID=A0A348HF55_9GAMM|nr:amino acid ABC transporter permease [Zymobacter palmae]BBG30257.1 ABC-type amino acid transport system, permease [Zymobacter palmae]